MLLECKFFEFLFVKFKLAFRKLRSYKKPLTDDVMVAMSRKKFSDETMKKVQWIRQMYSDWKQFRDMDPNLLGVQCNLEKLGEFSKEQLCNDLCRFITEVKKLDGTDFPPRTLYDIIICVQFWLESNGYNWRLVSGSEFETLKFTLDNCMKQRAAAGIGGNVRKAEVLTFTDEDLLWSLGLLGCHTPQALLDTVVFKLGLSCALRAGKEHRILRSIPFKSQFEFLHDSTGSMYLRYTEDLGLKTNKGGLKHRNLDRKVVDVYCISDISRCPVRIFMTYLSCLPKNRITKALYLQPRKKFTDHSWFLDRPVGVNTLRDTVKNLCSKAGLPGYYTNHSLRSSSATRMYHNGIEEQIIQEVTGHRSNAVRSYKRSSDLQRQVASRIISGDVKMS